MSEFIIDGCGDRRRVLWAEKLDKSLESQSRLLICEKEGNLLMIQRDYEKGELVEDAGYDMLFTDCDTAENFAQGILESIAAMRGEK